MRVYLFDIDGTLLRAGGAGQLAMEEAFLDLFGVAARSEQVAFAGRTDRAITHDLLRASGIAETPDNVARYLDSYFERLPRTLALRVGRVLPGVEALLQRLRQRDDVAVGLLTGNARRGAELKLSHYGLWQHFAFGGFGDDSFDRDDVARAAFTAAETALSRSLKPCQVWVIGDTPLDVTCARAIGARAVAVATGWHSTAQLAAAKPDILLSDLTDPEPLLVD